MFLRNDKIKSRKPQKKIPFFRLIPSRKKHILRFCAYGFIFNIFEFRRYFLMKTCPICGAEVKDGVTECPICGAPIEEKNDTKTCPICGAEVKDGVTECPICGAPIGEENNA